MTLSTLLETNKLPVTFNLTGPTKIRITGRLFHLHDGRYQIRNCNHYFSPTFSLDCVNSVTQNLDGSLILNFKGA